MKFFGGYFRNIFFFSDETTIIFVRYIRNHFVSIIFYCILFRLYYMRTLQINLLLLIILLFRCEFVPLVQSYSNTNPPVCWKLNLQKKNIYKLIKIKEIFYNHSIPLYDFYSFYLM